MAHLRPESELADTGTVGGDLQAWAEQYLDEMSSDIGLAMMRDLLAGSGLGGMPAPCQCAAYTACQILVIVECGIARRQAMPEVDAVMDGIVAPFVYRALFAASRTTRAHVLALVDECMTGAIRQPRMKSTPIA